MDEHLEAGVAIYNAGEFHAAHDAWEEPWLDCDRGTDDEQLLHGLIQFTAAIYHATRKNAEGATGLATSAREYLRDLDDHRGVNVARARRYLARLAVEPGIVEHADPPLLTIDGEAPTLDGIGFEVGAIAACVLAAEYGYDVEVFERAIAHARRDLADQQETSPFVTLVLDFARDTNHRGIVAERLREHTERREAREAGLEGLFENGNGNGNGDQPRNE